jgi:TPP-dependent pyruvate/acetoin dehydrogenase alpha subunit
MLDEFVAGRDPVKNFQERMLGWNVVSQDDVDEIQARVEREFDEGYEFALHSPFPEPGDAFKGNWTEDGYWTNEPGRGGGTEA